MNRKIYLYQILTYLGTLPFICCAILLLLGYESIPYLGSTMNTLCTYGLIIVVFISGLHWGMAMHHQNTNTYLIVSNFITIFLWLSYLILTPSMLVLMLILALSALLYMDISLVRLNLSTRSYLSMRVYATTIVCTSLLVVLAHTF